MNMDFLKGYDFFTGVPDSQLKPLCDYLMKTHGISKNHIIGANEGNCVAMAAGYHLATGKIPVVYMQNSGIGNVINPVASLTNDKVYAIPMIFVVGWRGEPGIHDEPQHVYQGEVTLKLLRDMDISAFVIDKNTTRAELAAQMEANQNVLARGKSVAFVIKKGALSFDEAVTYENAHTMLREECIRQIAKAAGADVIVSTTGKASRELFEIREQLNQSHEKDFLTVGSMGHSSSIALSIALHKPQKRVWCIDGDGAALMHMGAMAVVGANKPGNMVHVILNNGAHETVGGMPTVSSSIDLCQIAKGCGYPRAMRVSTYAELDAALESAIAGNGLCLIEICVSLASRANLGRPTTTPEENKEAFVRYVRG